MPASPNDPRTKRRKAAGDDINKMGMAPQPIPGLPQNQKGGNVANYAAFDKDGQMGQQMGTAGGFLPYGDMKVDKKGEAALGNIGFVGVSGQPQNIVPGRAQNMGAAYNAQMQPDLMSMEMMEPAYEIASAAGKTMPNGLNNGKPVSYNVTALGPTGGRDPGMLPPELSYSSENNLPMSGGMSTGRGGGRNKGKK